MTEPKTVSNLPLDVSIRWAEDQKALEESRPIIRDSTLAAANAQTEVILPTKHTEIENLLGLSQLHPSWATFEKPPGFLMVRRRIFRSQLVPFLGSDEQQDAILTRIQNTPGTEEGDEEGKGRLVNLLQLLQTLNKDLIDITTRCKQYQKG